jgi:dephospho-CoA kinase
MIPRLTQRRRLKEKNGLSPEQIRSEMPMDEKAKFADFIVNTSKELERTRLPVEEIYRELRALAMTRIGETDKRD